jgi:hypothetical protein
MSRIADRPCYYCRNECVDAGQFCTKHDRESKIPRKKAESLQQAIKDWEYASRELAARKQKPAPPEKPCAKRADLLKALWHERRIERAKFEEEITRFYVGSWLFCQWQDKRAKGKKK